MRKLFLLADAQCTEQAKHGMLLVCTPHGLGVTTFPSFEAILGLDTSDGWMGPAWNDKYVALLDDHLVLFESQTECQSRRAEAMLEIRDSTSENFNKRSVVDAMLTLKAVSSTFGGTYHTLVVEARSETGAIRLKGEKGQLEMLKACMEEASRIVHRLDESEILIEVSVLTSICSSLDACSTHSLCMV